MKAGAQPHGVLLQVQMWALQIARLGAIGMAVSMPISRAVFNLSVAVMILGWLLSGDWRQKLQTITASAISVASMAFFAVCALSLLWVPDIGPDQWDALRGYSRLLCVPLLISLLNVPVWHRRAWNALLTGMLITLLVYTLDIWFEIPGTHSYGTQTAGQGAFYHHIAQGMVLSFLGACALHFGWQSQPQDKRRWIWWGIALAVAAGLLTVGQSRTGQLSVIAAYLLVVLGHSTKRLRAFGLVAIVATVATFIALSPKTQDRLLLGWKEAASFQQDGEHTSVGARLKAWEFSWQHISESPWLGSGVGTYSEQAHSHFKDSPVCKLAVCEQPHNQFVATAFETGMSGLVFLMTLLAMPLVKSPGLTSQTTSTVTAAAFVAIVTITCLFDSSFKIQGQLFFIITALGILGSANPSVTQATNATPLHNATNSPSSS